MINFDKEYFQEFEYSDEQTDTYFQNARDDYKLAASNKNPDIIFRFIYEAIIKLGIALIAACGFKIRGIVGHHAKILEKLGEVLEIKEEIHYLNRARKKRNIDLYLGGSEFTYKEAEDILKLANRIFSKEAAIRAKLMKK